MTKHEREIDRILDINHPGCVGDFWYEVFHRFDCEPSIPADISARIALLCENAARETLKAHYEEK